MSLRIHCKENTLFDINNCMKMKEIGQAGVTGEWSLPTPPMVLIRENVNNME